VRFIRRVNIRDFRSIARLDLGPIGDFVPVVGLNGTGKSNLLRALNAFFNDEVENGEPLDLRRDFREPGRKAKRKVEVEVDLDPSAFPDLRDEIVDALQKVGGTDQVLTVRKEWTVDPITHDTVVSVFVGRPGSSAPADQAQLPLVARLLSLVRFRYLPNHVHPSTVLESEQESMRRLLFNRLGKRHSLRPPLDFIAGVRNVAAELMKPVYAEMNQTTGVEGVEISTPADWRELVWALGLRMRSRQSQSFETLLHGSGIQSVLAYTILREIDTSFSGSFGWRRGAIWALEEPESFLHSGLQAELARSLSAYADNDPIQILLSTHSHAFLGGSATGILVDLDPLGRTTSTIVDRPTLIRQAYRSGAVPFGHPLHTGPPKPLLLVEGEFDRDLIARAYRLTGTVNPYEIACLGDLDSTTKGGDSQIASWLRYQTDAIAARPHSSPIVVVLDWEVKDSAVRSVEAALQGHPASVARKWPKDLTNPDLSDRFVGVEKALSTHFIEHCQSLGLTLTTPAPGSTATWKYDVDRGSLKEAKTAIHRELATRKVKGDTQYLNKGLRWLNGLLNPSVPIF
jgi:energy-coupling factor transporter ATP-binding protein EcfA2